MQEQGKALEGRTKEFAVAVLWLVRALPSSTADQVLGRQLLRAASAIGANYRAARRSRSAREFVARLAVVVEESDESVYWLEIFARMPTGPSQDLRGFLQESRQLRAIFSASLRTAKSRMCGA